MYKEVKKYDYYRGGINNLLIEDLLKISREDAALVLVYGNIGVGKSNLIRRFIKRVFKKYEYVPSPSFLSYHIYKEDSNFAVVHYDFYKLKLLDRLPDRISVHELVPDELEENMRYMLFIEWSPPLGDIFDLKYLSSVYTLSILPVISRDSVDQNKIYLCKCTI